MKRFAALVAAAAGVALALWWLQAPVPEAPPPGRVLAHADVEPAPSPAPAAPPAVSPASAKLAELRAMSPSVLGTTFVTAIRGAGYVCEDVTAVDQGEAGAPVWRASCPDFRAYLVGVSEQGAFTVEPTLDHWDAVAPPVVPAPQRNPPDLLGPRDLRR